ncbi:MAG: HD-GYP domain-containing protein [Humidesulfovibrio sp.]|uniref:HD-GYP domain-containing protein n=1 Tax=Humidesulfovibrio sp. TaxID=2910988 RepID=UPI002734F81D|nr:HD-GYP domain-containing protein [Humidesulfovibrio sp.]MDP2848585.1 HD-GYP domain-containing protein [Humidesulfovibrio sp.]
MQQRIKRSALKPGMYVVSHGLGTFDDPLVRVDKPLLTPADIAALVPADVEDVTVDTSISISLLGQVRPVGVPITTSIGDELPIARRLYADALVHVKSFVDDVRKGTDIDYRKATPLVENFIESVFRNENAAVTLFKLRDFDEYTYTHSLNVSLLAVLLGKHLGIDKPTLLKLGLAGMYHDVGKARIPEAVLNKPGKLTEAEFNTMKAHPLEGYKVMVNQPDLDPEILRAVVEHHERFDGTGYPRGLTGEQIGRFSRIISVVDVYDALTSKRVYKGAMAPAKALGMMYQWRDKDFPPSAIESFIRCIGVFPVGSFVRLSGGEYGIVAGVNPLKPTKPEIKVILDAKMRPQIPRTLELWRLDGSPEAQDIIQVLNPAEHKIDLELFFLS